MFDRCELGSRMGWFVYHVRHHEGKWMVEAGYLLGMKTKGDDWRVKLHNHRWQDMGDPANWFRHDEKPRAEQRRAQLEEAESNRQAPPQTEPLPEGWEEKEGRFLYTPNQSCKGPVLQVDRRGYHVLRECQITPGSWYEPFVQALTVDAPALMERLYKEDR